MCLDAKINTQISNTLKQIHTKERLIARRLYSCDIAESVLIDPTDFVSRLHSISYIWSIVWQECTDPFFRFIQSLIEPTEYDIRLSNCLCVVEHAVEHL